MRYTFYLWKWTPVTMVKRPRNRLKWNIEDDFELLLILNLEISAIVFIWTCNMTKVLLYTVKNFVIQQKKGVAAVGIKVLGNSYFLKSPKQWHLFSAIARFSFKLLSSVVHTWYFLPNWYTLSILYIWIISIRKCLKILEHTLLFSLLPKQRFSFFIFEFLIATP